MSGAREKKGFRCNQQILDFVFCALKSWNTNEVASQRYLHMNANTWNKKANESYLLPLLLSTLNVYLHATKGRSKVVGQFYPRNHPIQEYCLIASEFCIHMQICFWRLRKLRMYTITLAMSWFDRPVFSSWTYLYLVIQLGQPLPGKIFLITLCTTNWKKSMLIWLFGVNYEHTPWPDNAYINPTMDALHKNRSIQPKRCHYVVIIQRYSKKMNCVFVLNALPF